MSSFLYSLIGKTHDQDSERTEEANNKFGHKARPRLIMEAELGEKGQHILILMHFKVCSYVSPCGVLCLCFLRGGVLVCILEHISICLTQCLPTGEVQVQQLIDTGALVTWTEANGLEMVASVSLIDTGALATTAAISVASASAAVSVASASPSVSAPPLSVTMPKAPPHGPPDATVAGKVGGATTQKNSFGGSRERSQSPGRKLICQQCQGNWGESAESYEEDESYESDESYEGLRRKETYGSDESYES